MTEENPQNPENEKEEGLKPYNVQDLEVAILTLVTNHGIFFEGDLIEGLANISKCIAGKDTLVSDLEKRIDDIDDESEASTVELEKKLEAANLQVAALLKRNAREREVYSNMVKFLCDDRDQYKARYYILAEKVFDIKFIEASESTLPGYPGFVK